MSGGVDSSVSAVLLKKAGFDVTGVYIRFWSNESEKRARAVAKKIGIPFKVVSFKKEFKKLVVDYFIDSYKKGLTPNPCVVCNKELKFGLLLKRFKGYIATGHYVRVKDNKLLKGRGKDQSYFLWSINPKALDRVLFPVGGYTKEEVKKMAKDFKLPVVDIPESQEACFISDSFIKKYITKSKDIVYNNKVIVRGSGLYTIGQRKGLDLPGGPFYILDVKKNKVIVTKNENDLFKKGLTFKKANWFIKPKFPLKVKAKIRYRHKMAEAIVNKNKVIFTKPQRAVTPGQSIVFYNKDQLLGGGIII